MKPPKSITITKSNVANKTEDIPNLSKQQLYENPELTAKIITDDVSAGQTFFPKSIHIEDMDNAFVEWVRGFKYQVSGKLVPVNLYTLQRLSEYMQNWDQLDTTDHPSLPLITITKETPAKQGTTLGGYSSTLPSDFTYPLYKIPRIVNGKTVFDYVEIPQPTYVDLQYKINVFTNTLRDLNVFNEIILQDFKKPQNAISVFEHNMEIHLDDISENHKSEIEERRFYRQIFVINLKGFLLDEADFKVKRSLNSIEISVEPLDVKKSRVCEIDLVTKSESCETCLLFNFNRKSSGTATYKMPFGMNILYDNQSTLFHNTHYFVNNVPATMPFAVQQGYDLKVVYNAELTKPVIVKLCGEKIP